MATRVCPICDIADCATHRPSETETVREQRKYSVDEIDAMRGYVRDLATFYRFFEDECNFSWTDSALSESEIEDRLRTYMVGGIAPDELQAKATAHLKEQNDRVAEASARRRARREEAEKKPRGATEAELDELLSQMPKVDDGAVVEQAFQSVPPLFRWIAFAVLVVIGYSLFRLA